MSEDDRVDRVEDKEDFWDITDVGCGDPARSSVFRRDVGGEQVVLQGEVGADPASNETFSPRDMSDAEGNSRRTTFRSADIHLN